MSTQILPEIKAQGAVAVHPVAESERIASLDVLRGFALLGHFAHEHSIVRHD